jgi:predicted TIM-barrel fold metal-dependent hydrolase
VDDKLIVVSADSHAGMPLELWPEYLDPRYHHLLPELHEESVICPTALYLVNAKNRTTDFPEHTEAHRTGWHGLHDARLRLETMDAEGIAAEVVYSGDSRLHDLFFSVTNRPYPFDVWHAGAQGWNRWAADTFGVERDRFLLTAAVGPCVDMDATIAELEWLAGAGFVATYAPGYMHHAGLAPLYDAYWDPFWAACADLGLAVVVHAGFGTEQGSLYAEFERIYDDAARAAGSRDRDAVMAHPDAVSDESRKYIANLASHSLPARRPLWQLTLGGVFDRHPTLKFVLSEIRVDWLPETLQYLDGVYDEHRADLPTTRRPSEHWASNCAAVASFIHKAEVGMFAEAGRENVFFGRDYPHQEGTWPHTRQWLSDACVGLPEEELRLLLGENAIRFYGLDRTRLAAIADRIGPSVEEISGRDPQLPEALVQNFSRRGGYLKPIEGDRQLAAVADLVTEDLAGIGAS